MKLSLLVAIPALFAPIAAQAKSKSKCAVQYQVDVCIKDANNAIKACGTDPACVCQKNKDKGQCYIVCPDDEDNQGQAKLQDAQIGIYCNVPGAIPTTTKPADKPAPTDDSNPNKPSGSGKDKDTGSSDKDTGSSKDKGTGSSGTSASSSAPKSGSSANSQFGSVSFVAISMGILASFL
ncbi:hypothetical protein CONCODRAFT_79353 [Conidiobolus coronatus NRRL 28638]|uniref:Extracellular membrane protein CFEM domain-containing protein n=1 Tax=Conidiobolus coronatus (strain ATCC 28846 / CBS 209.66 / NRRL 28638) TaxID=796925 RepID=A0A137P2V1_CONC2|nr:hypothetical protein CONCODRAFT_79353 [Conidiobolus coronatus NRRL 28638]|eukprot:KXN69332.1 hypothetical protein CONCODRAFT_79353 [Conidiobolus coronatus NRRL 28638]